MSQDRLVQLGWSWGLVMASLLSLSSPASAASSCPDNMIAAHASHIGFWSSAPTGSVIWVEGSGEQFVSWDPTQPCSGGCYNLPKATLAAVGYNTLYGPAGSSVRVADDYVVVGAAGPALSFDVLLQLDATIDVEGTVTASVGRDGSTPTTIERTTTGITHAALPIAVAPGTPFRLEANVFAVGGYFGGTGMAVATIRFGGLPAGYAITSCQGFDHFTPALATTWGGVKAHYR
jgi:hypothetical protein